MLKSTCKTMLCQVNLFTCVSCSSFQPTQQNARAHRSSYASADNDGTPHLRILSSKLLVFYGQCSPSLTTLSFFFLPREFEFACRGVFVGRNRGFAVMMPKLLPCQITSTGAYSMPEVELCSFSCGISGFFHIQKCLNQLGMNIS